MTMAEQCKDRMMQVGHSPAETAMVRQELWGEFAGELAPTESSTAGLVNFPPTVSDWSRSAWH